jgi:hypothetical protein
MVCVLLAASWACPGKAAACDKDEAQRCMCQHNTTSMRVHSNVVLLRHETWRIAFTAAVLQDHVCKCAGQESLAGCLTLTCRHRPAGFVVPRPSGRL